MNTLPKTITIAKVKMELQNQNLVPFKLKKKLVEQLMKFHKLLHNCLLLTKYMDNLRNKILIKILYIIQIINNFYKLCS